MTLDLLFAGRFAAWLAAAPRPPLWLFVHVPKTAGSSLAADLAPQIGPYASIHIDHGERSLPGPARFDLAVAAFLARRDEAGTRFASGHVLWRHAAQIRAAVPGAHMFTMLRDPIGRLVSDYLYQRSSMHPLWREVRAKAPDFAAFLDLPGPRNRAARHLVPAPIIADGDGAAAIAHVRAHFAFVGVQDRYALGFRALTALFGQARSPTSRRRVNDESPEDKDAVLAALGDPALRKRALALNAMDAALWDHFAAEWARIERPLDAFLGECLRTEP